MDSDILQTLDLRQLGRRLQEARKARGLTQQDVAKQMGMARTTVTAIEKGERRVQPGELIQFAALYGRAIEEFLRQGEPVEAFTVQLRATMTYGAPSADDVAGPIGDLQRLCEDYLELERICGAPLPRRYPPPYPVGRIPSEAAGEDGASAERNRLGLGDGPILNLRDVLESDVGLRVFYLELPSKVAAMFAYTDVLGGCIAVNRTHPEERRRMSLAHDYGHFLTNRYVSEITLIDGYHRQPEHERVAEAFARNFLVPAEGLRRRFRELKQSREGRMTYADLVVLADLYVVSFQAMVLRLEELRFLAQGTWEKLRQSKFRVQEAKSLLGLQPPHADDNSLPKRYRYLAVEAFKRGEITEGTLARFLRVDRLDARRIAEELSQKIEVNAEGVSDAVSLDLGEPLPERAS